MPLFASLSQPDHKNKKKMYTVSFIEFIKPKNIYWWLQDNRMKQDNYGSILDDPDQYGTISTATRQSIPYQDKTLFEL